MAPLGIDLDGETGGNEDLEIDWANGWFLVVDVDDEDFIWLCHQSLEERRGNQGPKRRSERT